MCGLSAFFTFQSSPTTRRPGERDSESWREELLSQLDCSVESMRHRGPDAKGLWVSQDNGVGLGHVRLATRDLTSAGDQPLHSADPQDDIHVIVNGELYFAPELREELRKGYDFQSQSDSEMAIALYRNYGVGFTEHLRGEFALVIYDGKNETLIAARDRFGVKPLHYAIVDGNLFLATQCKGIAEFFKANKQPLRWDVRCLAQGGGHYGNQTLFEGIRKFPAGHVLVVQKGEAQVPDSVPYWTNKYPANSGAEDDRAPDELIAELRARLVESVRFRLESTDVPVGILLSGGVDSSAVAGMATALVQERSESSSGKEAAQLPTCFTISFPGRGELDESAVATRTASALGLPHEKIDMTEQMFADEFEESCWLGETLFWDLQHIAKKALSRHISRRGFRVVLNGDGSDELFGGYLFFVGARLLEDDKRWSEALQAADSKQRERLRQRHAETAIWFGVRVAAEQNHLARALKLPMEFTSLAMPRFDNWLSDDVRKLDGPFRALYECFSAEEVRNMASLHPMHRCFLAWQKTFLPNVVIAAISDGAEMAHGVESRPPFLDHVVAEFASTLPVDALVRLDGGANGPVEKWIFREAVKPYVTDEVYARRKHTFAAPFRWKVGGPLYNTLSKLITRRNVVQLGFVDWRQCKSLVDDAFLGDEQLFRQALMLAQIISIGQQFGVERWTREVDASRVAEDSVRSRI